MNDRFKFRVWDIEEWTYLKCKYSKSAGYHKYTFGKHNVWQDIGYFIESNPKYYIVEQCTGLKDNCGNLIYEGDIIGDGEDDYVIKWDSNRTMFVAEDVDTSYEIEDVLDPTICVIGNVHNQPEQKDK